MIYRGELPCRAVPFVIEFSIVKQGFFYRTAVNIVTFKGVEAMAEKPENAKEGNGFMIKVATFIVDRRNLFFLLFGIAIIFSLVSMNWVNVENAM